MKNQSNIQLNVTKGVQKKPDGLWGEKIVCHTFQMIIAVEGYVYSTPFFTAESEDEIGTIVERQQSMLSKGKVEKVIK